MNDILLTVLTDLRLEQRPLLHRDSKIPQHNSLRRHADDHLGVTARVKIIRGIRSYPTIG